MAYQHTIRVHEDVGDEVRKRVVELCEKTQGSFLVVRETDASRVHYQGWIRCDVKLQALRARFKVLFPEVVEDDSKKGNKSYSLGTVKDEETWKRYLLKGTKDELPDVVAYRGIDITPEFIKKEHDAYWAKSGRGGKSQKCIVEEVEEWARAQKFDNEDVAHREIAEFTATHIAVVCKKPLNVQYARYVVNSVLFRMYQGHRKSIVNEIISRY